MKRKAACILLALVLSMSLVLTAVSTVAADISEVWVDDDFTSSTPGWGTTHFAKIQEGIGAVSSGGTVHVLSGTYGEWLTVDKPLKLQGEDKNTTILEAPYFSTLDGIHVKDISGVTISDLTIKKYRFEIHLENSHNNRITNNIMEDKAHLSVDYCGIRTSNADNNQIDNNTFRNNEFGIYLHSGSEGNHIEGNTFSNNIVSAIRINSSSNNTLKDNSVVNNAYGVMVEYNSNGNIVEENDISGNSFHGIRLFRCSQNEILNNIISDNSLHGLFICEGDFNEIIGNTISRNGSITDTRYRGISLNVESVLADSTGNIIADNIISDNPQEGIKLFQNVTDTEIYNNTIENNNYGIYIYQAQNSCVYHNNIINNSTAQAVDSNPASNNWHEPDLLEGNYWSDYTGVDDGSGAGKHAIAGDGIGDTLIPHPAAGFDNYPFTSQIVFESSVISATVDVNPDTLNLKSKGKWVTVHIELPVGYDVGDIDIGTVRLEDTVSPESKPVEIGDYDADGIADLMVKFDKAAVVAVVGAGEEAELVVTGEVAGTPFEGSDTIRIK